MMLKNMSAELIDRLTVVAEFRDTGTGFHNSRMGRYAKVMSQALSMPEAFVEAVNFASPLHDIGKVGIPDTILLKPATLTEAETEIIKKTYLHRGTGALRIVLSLHPDGGIHRIEPS